MTEAADFDEFVHGRGRALLRFAYVLSGDAHLAEDLVQEVLARVHRRWDKITTMDHPEAYVRAAIVRQFLSWRRRRASSEKVLAQVPEPRTVDVEPAKQYTLYWPESANRWIQLATDDTYTTAQVVGLAASLTPASIPVRPPFTLDLAPAGLPVDTITPSTLSFGNDFRTVLRKRRPLTSPDRMVGAYQASLSHSAAGVTLDIDVTDWNATLEITVGTGLTMADADLLRYAAGVHILNRSDPE
jgi:hypothetical protein